MVAEIVAISDVDFITYNDVKSFKKLHLYSQLSSDKYYGFCSLDLTTNFKIMNHDSFYIKQPFTLFNQRRTQQINKQDL